MSEKKRIFVSGATGYIGGRLIPRLVQAGYRVRAAGRNMDKLNSRPWSKLEEVELAQVDLIEGSELTEALSGCEAAYYLVHSMVGEQTDFAKADRSAAENMVRASEQSGIQRIVYLGGLGSQAPSLSEHLASRNEVGAILQQGRTPVTTFRAAMIIGSGSASFEILRYLVDRLPLMITPKWVHTVSQPIAIANVLAYLIECLKHPETQGNTYDIGGQEIISYLDLMKLYAKCAGLSERVILPVPVLTPKLSSYWIHLVTPIPAHIARPLAEGLRNPVVCEENTILQIIPQKLLSCEEAITKALRLLKRNEVETHWTDAGLIQPVEWANPGDPQWSGGKLYKDQRAVKIEAPITSVWRALCGMGGERGWYFANWLWHLRGWIDRILGGVGLQRGRRDSEHLRVGDAIDFWRVAVLEKHKRLVLVAEMKLPGRAVLEFRLNSRAPQCTELTQTAYFLPQGIGGLLYWNAVSPFHNFIFRGLLEGIAKASD